jgi:hypothetical protein
MGRWSDFKERYKNWARPTNGFWRDRGLPVVAATASVVDHLGVVETVWGAINLVAPNQTVRGSVNRFLPDDMQLSARAPSGHLVRMAAGATSLLSGLNEGSGVPDLSALGHITDHKTAALYGAATGLLALRQGVRVIGGRREQRAALAPAQRRDASHQVNPASRPRRVDPTAAPGVEVVRRPDPRGH